MSVLHRVVAGLGKGKQAPAAVDLPANHVVMEVNLNMHQTVSARHMVQILY